MSLRRALHTKVGVALLAVIAVSACGQAGRPQGSSNDVPSVVATTSILGDVAKEIAGDKATVTTLMPNGTDPHSFSASAAQVNDMNEADLLIVNGAGLEENLADAIEQAEAVGVPVFTAIEHVNTRTITGEGATDPHFWLDPLSMQLVVSALGSQIATHLGLDVTAAVKAYTAKLSEAQASNEALVTPIPASRRKIVTGHDALGYWANRYGFKVIGIVIPSSSTQAETSASDLAELHDTIEASGVNVIFADIGQSPQLARQAAADTDTKVVQLDVESLPQDGSYITLVKNLTKTIAKWTG